MASWTRRPAIAPEPEWLAYRQMDARWPPLWHGAGVGIAQPTGRWNGLGATLGSYAQYLACHPDGMWAELIRQVGLRGEERRRQLRRVVYRVRVRPSAIADLRDFDRWTGCGLDPWIAVDDDHAASRALAAELHAAGFDGVLAPSASLPGHVNLTLFGPRQEAPDDDTGRWPRPDVFCPTVVVADRAAPPGGLDLRVRFRGMPHRTFEGWKPSARRLP
ncbi:MAG TPA: RES family NAD+ phosphorylase [Baekduia sp.]|nr:RES family NAD+ phosphorylase [Baekduia sp.]